MKRLIRPHVIVPSIHQLWLLPVVTFLLLSGCKGKPINPYLAYTPPYIPITFVVDKSGIQIESGLTFVTFIGTFELGANLPLVPFEEDEESSNPVIIRTSPDRVQNPALVNSTATPGVTATPHLVSVEELPASDLLLILRDTAQNKDHIYHIKDGRSAFIIVDGRTQIAVTSNTIIIDITQSQIVELQIQE